MTPKEKALELVEKFRQKQFSGCIMCSDSYEDKDNDAKCLALIAVDEILNIQVVKNGFWQQVHTEIENLV